MAIDLTNTTPPPVPPGAPRRPSGARDSQKARAQKTAEREDGIQGLFQLTAAGLIMFGQVADAGACAQFGPPIARETASIAETSEPIARAIDFVTGVGPYAALIAAVIPFGLQILLNHKRIPNVPALAQFGVMPPEMLEVQARVQAERQQAELMAELRNEQERIAQANAEANAA